MRNLAYPRFQHGTPCASRFPTRALAEVELQFIEASGQAVGGTNDRFRNGATEN